MLREGEPRAEPFQRTGTDENLFSQTGGYRQEVDPD